VPGRESRYSCSGVRREENAAILFSIAGGGGKGRRFIPQEIAPSKKYKGGKLRILESSSSERKRLPASQFCQGGARRFPRGGKGGYLAQKRVPY